MMGKAILLMSVVAVLSGRVVAQSVVSSAGGGNATLSWTLGEVFTESVMRSNVVRFSQGFNQPFTISASGILNVKGDRFTFTAGPNPVADELYVTVADAGTSTWQLYDMQGRLLDSGRLDDTRQTVIAFSGRNAGEYVLKIGNEQGTRSVLIIKK